MSTVALCSSVKHGIQIQLPEFLRFRLMELVTGQRQLVVGLNIRLDFKFELG